MMVVAKTKRTDLIGWRLVGAMHLIVANLKSRLHQSDGHAGMVAGFHLRKLWGEVSSTFAVEP